jgi:O-antigen/teichoic acid export membrane protein
LISNASLTFFGFALLLDSALNALGLVTIYSMKNENIKQWRSSLKAAKNLMTDSSPLILSGIMKVVFLRIDQIMLAKMTNAAELGAYAVAVRLSEGFFFLPAILYASVFPAIVKAKETSDDLFYEKLQRLYNLMAFMGYMVIGFLTFSSSQIIHLLYGEEFTASAEMLMILAWSLLFINLGTGRGAFLLSMNWTRVHSLTMAGGCLINVLLNLLLIPRMGGVGAAIASVVAYGFAGYFSCFLYPPLFRTGGMMTKSILLPKVW